MGEINQYDLSNVMQVPYLWTGSSFSFNFGDLPVDRLADEIYYMFRTYNYKLSQYMRYDNKLTKGTKTDGIYRHDPESRYDTAYKFRVIIYSYNQETYLKISNAYNKTLTLNKNYWIGEINRLVGIIKYLRPDITGYLICNKCGSYYELKEGESPDDYYLNCDCGGTFEYLSNPNPSYKYEYDELLKSERIRKQIFLVIALLLIIIFALPFIMAILQTLSS